MKILFHHFRPFKALSLNEPEFEWQAKRSFHSLHFGIHSKFITGFRSPLFRLVFTRRLSSLRVSWSERNISYMPAHRTLTFSEFISLVLASEEMRKLWFSSRWRQLREPQKRREKLEEATIMFRFIEQHSHYVPSDSHSYLMSRRPPSILDRVLMLPKLWKQKNRRSLNRCHIHMSVHAARCVAWRLLLCLTTCRFRLWRE